MLEGSLEITLTVPLMKNCEVSTAFMELIKLMLKDEKEEKVERFK